MPAEPIDPTAFQNAFDHFQTLVQAKSGHPFRDFDEGLAAVWENYKPRLHDHANHILNSETWLESEIGSGSILERTIEAIEIQNSKLNLNNNLVFWQNRFGHANRDHRVFLEAKSSPNLRVEIERLLFELYRNDADDGIIFDKLSDLTGGKYPLLAYLFFLKDTNRFMPIQPTGFDRAFPKLSIDFTTLRQCSWENYSKFNEILNGLRPMIAHAASLETVRLIDAHSFCWIFTSLLKMEAEGSLGTSSEKKDDGRILGGREKSIIEMRLSTENTVRNSNGKSTERTVRNKELKMSSSELDQLIESLLNIQDNRCALTGIPFHFSAAHADKNLLPSLDRIDSDGHYETGNLQVVCRFINFWKSDSDNEEFKRLLMLVRGETYPHGRKQAALGNHAVQRMTRHL